MVGTVNGASTSFFSPKKTKESTKKQNPQTSHVVFSISSRINKKRCEEAEYLKFHKNPLGVCITNVRKPHGCHFDNSAPLKDEQGRLHDMALRAAHHARYLAFLEFFWEKYHGRYKNVGKYEQVLNNQV